ncbi:unnamed protein product, partial [Brassica rapa subsp. narinosa]
SLVKQSEEQPGDSGLQQPHLRQASPIHKSRYQAVVQFSKVKSANISTNNYALDEIEEVK